MDEVAQERGFENFQELSEFISNIDISTPQKQEAFDTWRTKDGSKEGVLKLSFLPKKVEQWKDDYLAQLKRMSNRDLLTSYTTLASTDDSDLYTNRYEFCWQAISEELETRLTKIGFL